MRQGDDMRPRYSTQRAVIFEIREGDEFSDNDLIGAACFFIGDVGEPFQLGRNIDEVAVLIQCELFVRY
jgi:hypothetical protein